MKVALIEEGLIDTQMLDWSVYDDDSYGLMTLVYSCALTFFPQTLRLRQLNDVWWRRDDEDDDDKRVERSEWEKKFIAN